jgi:predicted signal transduction protein with EAL and GGDEF domain
VDERAAGGARRGRRGLILLLVALTRFDAINLAFRRASGDAVLQAAARRIARQARRSGRQPGRAHRRRGFAVLLRAPAGPADARFLAHHLMEAMARPFVSGDHGHHHRQPHWHRRCRGGATPPPACCARASAALAEAKGQEGTPVSLIDADAERATARGDRLEIDLRRALDAGEIDVLFQPQVEVATGRITGVEALARWNHPDYGALGAATLFSVAERSDYLVQLSEHVQRKALRRSRRLAGAAAPAAGGAEHHGAGYRAARALRAVPGGAEASGLGRRPGDGGGHESGLIEDLTARPRC